MPWRITLPTGPASTTGNGRAAIYELPEGLLTVVEEGCLLALCTAEDAFRAYAGKEGQEE
jgi:hypothetical protein